MSDKARRKRSPPFVMIYRSWTRTEAWRAMSGAETKLLVLMLGIYNGSNNGEFYLAERTAAESLGMARNTVSRAFLGLQDKGFIRPVTKGHYDVKRLATTWRLTMWPAFGKVATHDYQKWAEQKP